MSGAAPLPGAGGLMSREEYLHWCAAQPRGRFERIEGRAVAMSPERANHADRKALAWLALRRAIKAAGLACHAFPDGMTVQVGDADDYEPDAVVRCGEPLPGDATVVPDPIVVVEVLSPSTRGGDLTRKLVEYFRIPSIAHYLVLWAERPQVLHHRRGASGGIDTRVIVSGDITLDPPGMTITLDELYERSDA